MDAELELDAAQALFAARLLEAAVHHPGPWTFEWGGVEIPTTKTETEAGVTFVGEFPEICWLEHPEGSLLLKCEGTIMGMRSISKDDDDYPGDTAFIVRWDVLAYKNRVPQ